MYPRQNRGTITYSNNPNSNSDTCNKVCLDGTFPVTVTTHFY